MRRYCVSSFRVSVVIIPVIIAMMLIIITMIAGLSAHLLILLVRCAARSISSVCSGAANSLELACFPVGDPTLLIPALDVLRSAEDLLVVLVVGYLHIMVM